MFDFRGIVKVVSSSNSLCLACWGFGLRIRDSKVSANVLRIGFAGYRESSQARNPVILVVKGSDVAFSLEFLEIAFGPVRDTC